MLAVLYPIGWPEPCDAPSTALNPGEFPRFPVTSVDTLSAQLLHYGPEFNFTLEGRPRHGSDRTTILVTAVLLLVATTAFVAGITCRMSTSMGLTKPWLLTLFPPHGSRFGQLAKTALLFSSNARSAS